MEPQKEIKKIITENISDEFRKLITLKIYKSFLAISSKIHIDSVISVEKKEGSDDDSKNSGAQPNE